MISLNVLGLPQPDVPALVDWLTRAKPRYTVVMDQNNGSQVWYNAGSAERRQIVCTPLTDGL